MTYTKPQLLGVSAIVAIQSGSSQRNGVNTETDQKPIPAYEADE
jgi:hypothetical protein